MKKQRLENNNREFAKITEEQQIAYLIEQYLDKKKVYIKGFDEEITAELEILYPNYLTRLVFPEEISERLIKDTIVIYTIAKRYIEITLKKNFFNGNEGEFELVEAKIAQSYRENSRISVVDDDFIVENFRLSKYIINPGMREAPICVQVAFDTLKPTIQQEFPECLVCVFEEKIKQKEVQAVFKSQNILYIEDIFDDSSFSSSDPMFVDYKAFLGTRFDQEIEDFKRDKVRSILVFPIIYTNVKNEKTAVGYFKMVSHTEPISKEVFPRLDYFSNLLTSNIRDANVQIIKSPQQVVNISRKGLQIKVKERHVIDVFRSNRNELVFSVKPSPTFRFTLFGKVASLLFGQDNNYSIGMEIIGGEEVRGLPDWNKYVDKIVQQK